MKKILVLIMALMIGSVFAETTQIEDGKYLIKNDNVYTDFITINIDEFGDYCDFFTSEFGLPMVHIFKKKDGKISCIDSTIDPIDPEIADLVRKFECITCDTYIRGFGSHMYVYNKLYDTYYYYSWNVYYHR